MICEVLTIGDERLLKVSTEVQQSEFNTPELDVLIQDMYDTMLEQGGVGIAAIQIGCLKRILLIGYDGESNQRYTSEIGLCPLTVVINPQIEAVGNEQADFNEGCLSVPGKRGMVSRPKHIRYSYYDQTGNLTRGESNGFFARVIQHEIDHLDGILFPMRIKDQSTIMDITDITE